MVAAFLKKALAKKADSPKDCCKKNTAPSKCGKHGLKGKHGAGEDDGDEDDGPAMSAMPPEGGPSHKLHGKKGGEKGQPIDQSQAIKHSSGVVETLAKKGAQDPKVVGASGFLMAKAAAAAKTPDSKAKKSAKEKEDKCGKGKEKGKKC